MKAKLLKQVRNQSNNKKLLASKYTTFIVCFLLSANVWLLLELGQFFTTELIVPVVYNGYPSDKLLVNIPAKTISLSVKAKGSKLLRKKITGFKQPLIVNLSQLSFLGNNKAYSTLSKNISSFKQQLGNDIDLLGVYPDTLKFEFANLVNKKLPIKVSSNISYKQQYMQSGNVSIMPDSVLVLGPEYILDTLQFIKTNFIELKGINESVNYKATLQKIDKNLTFDVNDVKVHVPVDQFTENSITLPIDSINKLNSNSSVRLFPKEIKLYYTTPLSKYNVVKPDDFVLKVDFLNSNNYTVKRVPVSVVKKPNYISVVRLEPNKVEYIIKK